MEFSRRIIQWYEGNKRDLPWRRTKDPYRIWISEIILQQTRVDQGLNYYLRFLEKFPDIETLALAEEEDVMKAWQGLGYYSRARNLHESAKTIYNVHDAVFPSSYEEIRQLKGIGDYSASAISSIAYGEPHPVIDGNVMRLVARFAGITEPVKSTVGTKKVRAFLDEHFDRDLPGVFNQAAMEMGAMVCKPRQPLCDQCPLNDLCYALKHDQVNILPVMNKPNKPQVRYLNYLVILSGDGPGRSLWMRKRTGEDIWKNLYDFPVVEADRELSPEEIRKSEEWKKITGNFSPHIVQEKILAPYLLSHRELRVKFFIVESSDYFHQNFIKVPLSDIYNYPVPRLIENILKIVT